MNLLSHSVTSTGRRSNNEDNLCEAAPLGLFAVADGLGGYEGGEVASAVAMETLREFIERARRDPEGTWPCREDKKRTLGENLVRAAAVAAHEAIQARRKGSLRQMGSTLAAVHISGNVAVVAHVGDSRVYRLRDGALSPLTRDHSLWAELVASGRDVPARADFPFKNQITRALGLDGNASAETRAIDVLPGDRFLLCTDGLYDPFDDETLEGLLKQGDARTCCARLVDLAYERGSSDNITAVIVDVS